MSAGFNNGPVPAQGQQTSSQSVSVVVASDQLPLPVSGTFSSASVGATGAAVPASAEQVAGKNPSGNLQAIAITAGGAVQTDSSATTQPISAAALPLPTGASTAANQTTANTSLATIATNTPAVGQKTMAASSPVTIASDQSSLGVTVGNFPATQAVSGTVAVSNFPATQPVSGTVTANIGTTNGLQLDTTGAKLNTAQGAAIAAVTGPMAQGSVTTAAPTYTTATVNPLSLTTAGGLRVDASGTTAPLPTGASTLAAQNTANTYLGSLVTNSPSLGQSTMSGSTPVVIASNQSTIPVSSAGRTSVATVYNAYSTTSVTTSAYVQLIASTPQGINRLYITDTSGSGFYIATGASGSEVNQLLFGPGGSDAVFELNIPPASRVSIKAADTNATSGSLFLTALS